MTEKERAEKLEALKKEAKELGKKVVKLAIKAIKVAALLCGIALIAIPTGIFKILSLMGEMIIKYSFNGLKYDILGFVKH